MPFDPHSPFPPDVTIAGNGQQEQETPGEPVLPDVLDPVTKGMLPRIGKKADPLHSSVVGTPLTKWRRRYEEKDDYPRTITVRLPEELSDRWSVLLASKEIPYQTWGQVGRDGILYLAELMAYHQATGDPDMVDFLILERIHARASHASGSQNRAQRYKHHLVQFTSQLLTTGALHTLHDELNYEWDLLMHLQDDDLRALYMGIWQHTGCVKIAVEMLEKNGYLMPNSVKILAGLTVTTSQGTGGGTITGINGEPQDELEVLEAIEEVA